MSIFLLFLVLAVIGVSAWAMVTYLPMAAPIKTVIVIVAVICCVLIALHAFGIGIPNPNVPHLK